MKEKLLVEEYKEAWLHYRHIEQMRIQHLAFFFTAFLAGTAAVAALAGKDPPTINQLTAAAVFLLVLIVIGLFVFISIQSMGPPMSHYEDVLTKVRLLAYGDKFSEYNLLFNLREKQEVKTRSQKGVIQRQAERVTVILLVIATLVEVWILFLINFPP